MITEVDEMAVSNRRSEINNELTKLRRIHVESLKTTNFINTWEPRDYAAYWERRNQIGLLRGELADLNAVSGYRAFD